jgi:hypothetical protein
LQEVIVVGSRWTFNHGPVSDNTYIAPYQVNYTFRPSINSPNTTSYYEWAGRANTMYNLYNPNIISKYYSRFNVAAKLADQYKDNDYSSMALTIGEVVLDRNAYVTIYKTVHDLANSPQTQKQISIMYQKEAQYHYQRYQSTGSSKHYNKYMHYRSLTEASRKKF